MAIYCTALFCCIVCYVILTSVWLRLHGSLLLSYLCHQVMAWSFLLTEIWLFPWILRRFTPNDKFEKNHFFYVSKSKNSRESYEAAGRSRSIWKQVHYYLFIFLSLFSTALPLLCVMFSFSYFFDFFNYLLSVWMYIFDRCIISFSLFFIPPIFFRLYFILFYFIMIFLFYFILNFVFFYSIS